jgi:hypothetical protein
LLAFIGAETELKVLEIVKQDLTVDQKQRAIHKLDARFADYTGPDWGKLLRCTRQSATSTLWWKNDRPRS